MDKAALDRYITREPDWTDDREPPECAECGEELTDAPSFTIDAVTIRRCDGKAQVIECRYDDGTHEGILAIIGEEFRDQSYKIAYAPACGTKEGGAGNTSGEAGEIGVEDAPSYEHEPHFFPDPYGCETTEVRVCSNGHENRVAVL